MDNLTTIEKMPISEKIWKDRYNDTRSKLAALLRGLEFEMIDEFIDNVSIEQIEGIGRGLAKIIKDKDNESK